MQPQTFQIDELWASYPRERWLAACAYPGGGIRDAELREILPVLYALFPQPGEQAHKEIPVRMLYGQAIDAHRHPEWTLVYYVDPGEPAVAIIVEGMRIEPAANTAILLPPMAEHSVEKSRSHRQRLSIALRWNESPIKAV